MKDDTVDRVVDVFAPNLGWYERAKLRDGALAELVDVKDAELERAHGEGYEEGMKRGLKEGREDGITDALAGARDVVGVARHDAMDDEFRKRGLI